MKKSLVAAAALAALIAGAGVGQCGENDIGLKASGNGLGPGGGVDVKNTAETNGMAVGMDRAARADSRAAANPNINRDNELRVVPKKASPDAVRR